MTSDMDRSEIAGIIRNEVAKYVDRDFSDEEQFVSDMRIASDDLSAIALTLEKRFSIKIERRRYREISNIDSYVKVVTEALAAKDTGGMSYQSLHSEEDHA